MNNDEIFQFLMQDEKIKNKYENQSMFIALITLLEDKGLISQAEFDEYLQNSKKTVKEKMIKGVSRGEKEHIEIRNWLEGGCNNERR
jgi:hypothetical protein